MKERITVTLDKEILDWVDKKILEKFFASRSHSFERLAMEEINEQNEKEQKQ